MKVEILPQTDIVTISKVVRLSDDDDDDDGAEDEGVTASNGTYCLDSQGSLWKKLSLASALLGGFDFADPQLIRERIDARKRKRKSKKKPVRVK